MEHPKDIGDRSTLAIILALREIGYSVLLPFGENTRYDLAIERAQNVWLVQCKTGRLARGVVEFRTASSVYLVPIDDLDVDSHASLRVAPCLNNQRKRIRFAADYEIGRIAIEGLRVSSGA